MELQSDSGKTGLFEEAAQTYFAATSVEQMKVVAWLSAIMICASLVAAVRLERLVKNEQAENAPQLWAQSKQKAQDKAFETLHRLMH